MLTIGDLDRRIEIQQVETAQDSYGAQTYTWDTYKYLWAKVFEKSGKVDDQADEMVAEQKTYFYIRNIGVTVNTSYRIIYDSKQYYIEVINEIDGRERFLEIQCKEKNNQTA